MPLIEVGNTTIRTERIDHMSKIYDKNSSDKGIVIYFKSGAEREIWFYGAWTRDEAWDKIMRYL